MKSRADALAKLIVDAREERDLSNKFRVRVESADSDERADLADIAIGGLAVLEDCNRRLADALEAEHAQRKQLESRVEKLRGALQQAEYDLCHLKDVPPKSTKTIYDIRAAMRAAADDALAKEQPKC